MAVIERPAALLFQCCCLLLRRILRSERAINRLLQCPVAWFYDAAAAAETTTMRLYLLRSKWEADVVRVASQLADVIAAPEKKMNKRWMYVQRLIIMCTGHMPLHLNKFDLDEILLKITWLCSLADLANDSDKGLATSFISIFDVGRLKFTRNDE